MTVKITKTKKIANLKELMNKAVYGSGADACEALTNYITTCFSYGMGITECAEASQVDRITKDTDLRDIWMNSTQLQPE